MTENEAMVFIKNEINVMVLQKNGAFGSPAANIFRTRNGAKRIETLEAIIGLITRLKQHQNIGSVEECREAMEKQKPKPCEFYGDEQDGKLLCPNCGEDLWDLKECGFNNCPYCGQAIDWEESEG